MSTLQSARDVRKRLLQLAPLLPLLFAYFQTARFLSDDGVCWQLVEVGNWKPQLVAWGFPKSPGELGHALDWPLLEQEPRLTRPLGNVFELFDTPFRAMLWRVSPIGPAISLTWLFSLVVSPLLLFLLLRRLGVQAWIGALAVAFFVASPGVLSLETMLFRPGKALADAAILFCLWLAARQDALRQSAAVAGHTLTVHFAGLCAAILVSLFIDEVALIVYPAVVLFFPRLVFRKQATFTLFGLIPVSYVAVIVWLMPALTRLAGYPDPCAYVPMASTARLVTFREPVSAFGIVGRNIVDNAQSILMDSFGLIRPSLAGSLYYSILFVAILLLGGAYTGLVITAACRGLLARVRSRSSHFVSDQTTGLAWRALIALVLALSYEGVLMTVSLSNGIGLRVWGLYYYGVFCSPFLAIALAAVCRTVRPPALMAVAFTLAVTCATTFVFPATNQVYKDAHYYPYRPGRRLNALFANAENRFAVRRSDSSLLKAKTVELWNAQTTKQPVRDVPRELSYVTYELGLLHTQIPWQHPLFDLTWKNGEAQALCHE